MSDLPQRFWDKVTKDDDGCWRWTAHLGRDGYATFPETSTGISKRAHRVAYEDAKAECVNGHPFDEANTYWWNGHRHCRACKKAWEERKRVRANA